MKRITTTIKREFLAAIVVGTKKTEYRERKPYWEKRFGVHGHAISLPFELRMINGMSKTAPEVTVLIDKIALSATDYKLHIKKILDVRNWEE